MGLLIGLGVYRVPTPGGIVDGGRVSRVGLSVRARIAIVSRDQVICALGFSAYERPPHRRYVREGYCASRPLVGRRRENLSECFAAVSLERISVELVCRVANRMQHAAGRDGRQQRCGPVEDGIKARAAAGVAVVHLRAKTGGTAELPGAHLPTGRSSRCDESPMQGFIAHRGLM